MSRPAVLSLILLAGWGAPGVRPAPPPDPQGPMRLSIEIPRSARAGAPVPVRLRLINESDAAIDVVLQGRPTAFDVVVRGPAGVVWRRLEGEVVSAILQLRRFEPGDSAVFETMWDQRDGVGRLVPPATYSVTGELPSDPPAVFRSPPAPLRIEP